MAERWISVHGYQGRYLLNTSGGARGDKEESEVRVRRQSS